MNVQDSRFLPGGRKSPPPCSSLAIVSSHCLWAMALASGLTRQCGAKSNSVLHREKDVEKHVFTKKILFTQSRVSTIQHTSNYHRV